MNAMPHWLTNFFAWWFIVALYFGLGFSIATTYAEHECWDDLGFWVLFWVFWPVLVVVLLCKRLFLEAFFAWLLAPVAARVRDCRAP